MVDRLQRVPLRQVWKHEALDFTRWLEANVDVLNEVIGLDLAAAERDQAAGNLTVDLIAEEEGSDRVAVIENQLERSDHDHLGKLVTYLSVIDAAIAVWIVAEPRPEHVTAVSWLNESRGAEFYLVKVEAVTISESEPAPLLTLIVGPSEEAREAGDTKRELAERHHTRLRFWEQLLDTARQRGVRLHSGVSPSKENWISTGAGISGLGFNYVVTQHSARVELYIGTGDKTENERFFIHFADHKDEIEQAFGEPLDWQPLPERDGARINAPVDDTGYRDEEEWPKLHVEMVDAMARLEGALRPCIQQLKQP